MPPMSSPLVGQITSDALETSGLHRLICRSEALSFRADVEIVLHLVTDQTEQRLRRLIGKFLRKMGGKFCRGILKTTPLLRVMGIIEMGATGTTIRLLCKLPPTMAMTARSFEEFEAFAAESWARISEGGQCSCREPNLGGFLLGIDRQFRKFTYDPVNNRRMTNTPKLVFTRDYAASDSR